MKKAQQTAVLCLILLPSLCFPWSGECVGVLDGDTIEVMHDGRAERIRLASIDCPEKRQDFGTKAKQFTAEMVFGKVVDVEPSTTDRYGRTIAWVSVAGKSLNKELVRAGLAWWYRKYAPADSELAALEKDACKAKRGLWSHPKPCPPWIYRKGKIRCSDYEHSCGSFEP